MTTQVSTSYDIFYGVRKTISPGNSFSIQYAIRNPVTNFGYSVIYSVRMLTPQGKVFNLLYSIRSTTSNSSSVAYGVRVSVASPTTLGLLYRVKKLVSYAPVVVYNTAVTGKTSVSKAVDIFFHTLIKTSGGTGGAYSTAFSNAYDSGVGTVKPPVDKVILTLLEPDPVPPQIVTTSFS